MKHETAFRTSASLRTKEIRGRSMETETVQERGETGVLAGVMAAAASGAERAAGGPSLQHVMSALGRYVKIQGTDDLEHLISCSHLGLCVS